MELEIERKFLPADNAPAGGWRQAVAGLAGSHIMQGYISTRPNGVVRVRIMDDRAFLTLKGRNQQGGSGVSALLPAAAVPPAAVGVCPEIRCEFEYPIPVDDARTLLNTLSETPVLEKIRYRVPCGDGLVWEVDEFLGRLAGLVLLEIELRQPEQAFPRPDWVGREVTGDPAYSNAVLATCPQPPDSAAQGGDR